MAARDLARPFFLAGFFRVSFDGLSERETTRSLQESEPALISVTFSILLCLSEVRYHCSKSAKGEKTFNLLRFLNARITDYCPRRVLAQKPKPEEAL